jgi:spore coat protein U-like protein
MRTFRSSTLKRIFTLILAAGLAAAGCVPAMAATTTANLALSMSINAACTVAGATLNFGSLTWLSAAVDGTTRFGVTCTTGTAYMVGLSVGSGSGATYAARMLKAGSSTVTYTLYQDLARTTVWGETGAAAVSGIGNGAQQVLYIYGRIPAQSTPAAGAYSDTVTVTVTY